MNSLYPKLDITNNFVITAVPSAPPAIEEKACSVDWNRLPEVEEPRWYQVTKTRKVLANVLFGTSACTGGATLYSAMWLTAKPLIVIGAFSGLAAATLALTITGVAFYALAQSPHDPQFRASKRLEAALLHKEGRLSLKEMESFGPTVLHRDEVQELLRYDIQTQSFSQFIEHHGEEVVGALSPESLFSLKIKYLAHVGAHEAGKVGLQQVLHRKISQQFGVSMRELASDFINQEIYRMYSTGAPYSEFIRRNGKEAISYVLGSNYQNWFINKFFDDLQLAMQGKGALDAETHFREDFTYLGDMVKESALLRVLLTSYSEFVEKGQRYEDFRAKNSVQHLKLLLARVPEALDRLTSRYLEMPYEQMSGEPFSEDRVLLDLSKEKIQWAMEERFKTMTLTQLLELLKDSFTVYSDGILHEGTKIARGLMFGRAVENHISRTGDLSALVTGMPKELILQSKNGRIGKLVASYLKEHAEGYLNDTLTLMHNDIIDRFAKTIKVQYQAQMKASKKAYAMQLEQATLHKERALVDAKAHVRLDRLEKELSQAGQAKTKSEQSLAILQSEIDQNRKELRHIESQRRMRQTKPLAHTLVQAEGDLQRARQRQHELLFGRDLEQLRQEIGVLEAQVRDLHTLGDARVRKAKIHAQIASKPLLQKEIKKAEKSKVEEVQGIVQAVGAHRKNRELEQTITSKQRELCHIEKDELELESLTGKITQLEQKAIDPNVATHLQRKRQEQAAREHAIRASSGIEELEREVSLLKIQRELETRYNSAQANAVALGIQYASKERSLQQDRLVYEHAEVAFTYVQIQYEKTRKLYENEHTRAVGAIEREQAVKATLCVQEHVQALHLI